MDEILAAAREFLEANRGRSATSQVAMYGYIANFQRFKQKDLEGALQTVEEALSKFPNEIRSFDLIALKGSILNEQGKPGEAEALFKPIWPRVGQAELRHATSVLPTYVRALQLQGRDAEANARVRELFDLKLRRMGLSESAWLYRQQVKLLTSQGRDAEALQWAKLHWMVCPFNETAIAGATQMLLSTWAISDTDATVGRAFLKAQTERDAPNPLTPVAVPTWSAEKLQQQLAMAGTSPGTGWGATLPNVALSERVTVLIMGGEWRRAMLMARTAMLNNPSSPDGVREACRVLKARDGSVVRANALLEWVKTKQGENPIAAFLKEHPSPDEATPATSTEATP